MPDRSNIFPRIKSQVELDWERDRAIRSMAHEKGQLFAKLLIAFFLIAAGAAFFSML